MVESRAQAILHIDRPSVALEITSTGVHNPLPLLQLLLLLLLLPLLTCNLRKKIYMKLSSVSFWPPGIEDVVDGCAGWNTWKRQAALCCPSTWLGTQMHVRQGVTAMPPLRQLQRMLLPAWLQLGHPPHMLHRHCRWERPCYPQVHTVLAGMLLFCHRQRQYQISDTAVTTDQDSSHEILPPSYR